MNELNALFVSVWITVMSRQLVSLALLEAWCALTVVDKGIPNNKISHVFEH